MICKSYRSTSAVALLAFIFVAAPAAAQSVTEARSEYEWGIELYRAGKYLDAVQAFQSAYGQRPKAMILYNIGQAQRKAGRFTDALASYRRFLGEATVAERQPVEVEARRMVAEIEEHLSTERALHNRQPVDQPTIDTHPRRSDPVVEREVAPVHDREATPEPTQTEVRHTPAYKRWWVWTIVGVGALSLAVGLGVGITQHQPSTSLGIVDGKF